ncbi:MAG: alpha/beta hydrolase, partial [Ignavibacteria bacterium]|nr:alpha/beta hydrolase [Ignavibacteria bacterium]
MAHKLFINNGKASMMYYGEAPWHGLGIKLEKPATSAEAIEAAGLDWEVRKEQLYLSSEKIINDYFATVRNNGEKPVVLGIVKRDYTILQNGEAFEFFDGIV